MKIHISALLNGGWADMSRLWLTVADEPLAAQECNVNTHFRYAQWWLNKLAEALVDGG